MKTLLFVFTIFIALSTCDSEENSKKTSADSIEVAKKNEPEVKTIFFDNEGIADIKLGMSLDEIKFGLADLTCEKVISEIDEIEFYRVTKGDEHICQFEVDQDENVMHISVGNAQKTDKGIGAFSTVEDVKKQYTVLPYKIVEGAEGLPFICLTIKEMPNVQLWLNFEVPEDYYTDEQKVLASVPDDSKIIGVYIEKP